MKKFSTSFFERPTLKVARDLIGAELVTIVDGVEAAGRIVEVEAYLGAMDPAAHSFRGRTVRTEAMFRRGGTCYVYFIYGVHYCVNVATRCEGIGEAVLIRAVEPLRGIEAMERRRRVKNLLHLASGPGKLCEALGIDLRMYGEDCCCSSSIRLQPGTPVPENSIVRAPRIGIRKAKDKNWRFFLKDSLFVSRRA